ncbi:MAG: membrane protein insertase YidC [Magnetococcales bacterium]|nr:membrane protein insertase YidC [Magnetococcales bacterium]
MDQRTLLAITLSFILLVVYQTLSDLYFPPPAPVVAQQPAEAAKPAEEKEKKAVEPGQPPQQVAALKQVEAESAPRGKSFSFNNGLIEGQILATGARVGELNFLKHLDKLPPEGKPIAFLQERGPHLFFEESGFLGEVGLELPNRKSEWQQQGSNALQPGSPLVLTWDNGRGLRFEKSISLEANSYLVTVLDRVVNQSGKPVTLYHFSHFVRIEPKPEGQQAMAVADFQGPMAYLDNVRVQHAYEELRKSDQRLNAQEGWIGFTDKYFLAAILPEQSGGSKKFYFDFDDPTHRVGVVAGKQEVETGAVVEKKTNLFIGPKEVRNLEVMNLKLERAIDYGWFHFLAVPLVKILLFFNDFFHNYGIAIILLTVIIKLLFFPLATKSYRSMNAMKKLAPKMEELKKLYAHDKALLQQETMKMYQENKVNPLGGCLPILVQIPVFFALYKVLLLSIEMRQAPFFLWVHDLSEMDPYYVLPLLMGASMFVQTKLNPAPADPVQAKVMLFLPVIFTFMFLSFPSGLVLYWLVNNLLSIAQQGYIMKQEG